MLMIMNNLDPAVAQVSLKSQLHHPESVISDTCLPSSSPRSSSPTEETARSSVTGRRYALVCHRRLCADASDFRITVSASVQFRLVMHYLSEMSEEQTLVMYSGHPLGLFPSLPSSPRAIITNGMVTDQHASSACIPVSCKAPLPPLPSGHS